MKSKKKTKVPAYVYGTGEAAAAEAILKGMLTYDKLLENAPEMANLLLSPFLKSTATTGREAVAQSIGDIASGAATGFKAAGLPGAIAGASIGLVGKSGERARMTSFTDYNEGSLGTGLIGAFGNRRLRRKRAAIKKNAYSNRAAVQGTDYLQSEAYDDMIGMNTDTMANGGMSSSLAYVDDGELIQTPDGSISKVPENNKPTDSNLVSLPEGSRILSDKLKVPGRKETFAQLGEKMMAKKKSKYNDRFAENAAKLNEMNNNMIHDLLFAMLESVKQSKGIKPKTKLIQAASLGDEIRKNSRLNTIYMGDTRYNVGDVFNYKGTTYRVTGTNEATPVKAREGYGGPASTDWPTQFNPASVSTQVIQPMSVVPDGSYTGNTTTAVTPVRKRRTSTAQTIDEEKPELPFTNINPLRAKHPELLTATNDEMVGLGNALTSHADNVTTLPKSNAHAKPKPHTKRKPHWGSALSGMASLAPVMSNLFAGKPETVDAVYNPYATSIANTMRRRRFNIDPAIEDVRRNRAISNYNMRLMNTSTGANLAHSLQSAVNTDRAIANLRSQESNVNNQYLGDYANTMNSLGQQWVNATNMANEANAQNRATTRNIRRAGLSQLSQWAQNRELMRNQKARDMEMWPLYQKFLQAGFTEDDLIAMMISNRNTTSRKKGGNNVG